MNKLLAFQRLPLILFLFFWSSCSMQEKEKTASQPPEPSLAGKPEYITTLIDGVSFEAPPALTDNKPFLKMREINADWVSLMPFGFARENSPEIHFNANGQWWGERDEGIAGCAMMSKKCGLKVMVKPQLWIGHGVFTGDVTFTADADWKTWEQGYAAFILHYAALADSIDADMYCIGTELAGFVKARPAFWNELITEVRSVYKGKITYAENWDKYTAVPFWKSLDYIGVDAYFPLSDTKLPTAGELEKNWKPYLETMQKLHQETGKQILFTEYGYCSKDYCAKNPWENNSGSDVNLQAQTAAFEALFRVMRKQNWYAGGFLWKWHATHDDAGGEKNADFTPQNKPVESIIRNWYKN